MLSCLLYLLRFVELISRAKSALKLYFCYAWNFMSPCVGIFYPQRKMFVRYASAFPCHKRLGWTPNPHTIRRCYGGIEIVSGVVMACSGGLLCDLSNCSLLGLIFYSLYSTWALDNGMKEASHSIVLGLVLCCRFVIRLQVSSVLSSFSDGLQSSRIRSFICTS